MENKEMAILTYHDHYEPGEYEVEFDNLDDAITKAECVREEGGWAEVTDAEGNIYEFY